MDALNIKAALLALVFLLSACCSFLKLPPLPKEPVSLSEELKYIFDTDQKDRKQNMLRFIFLSEAKLEKNAKVQAVSDRDSIRLKRVILFNAEQKLTAPQDCFYAAIIYIHNGGSKMAAQRPAFLETAITLLNITISTSPDTKLKKRASSIRDYEIKDLENERKAQNNKQAAE